MRCPSCGKKNPNEYNFCPVCGIELHKSEPETIDTQPLAIVGGKNNHRPASLEDVEGQLGLIEKLRVRLFTNETAKSRIDVEQWMTLHQERQQRISLVGARLRGLALGRFEFVGIDLRMADLSEADLQGANLFLANLRGVNLKEAYLFLANLQEADLGGADLRGANLQLANLIRSNLRIANLHGANLQRTKLQDANLRGANLEDAIFLADLNVNTILPDGSQWQPGVEMERFTDRQHPEFWRSGDPNSPAYRGA